MRRQTPTQQINRILSWCQRHGIAINKSMDGNSEFFFVKHRDKAYGVKFLYQEIKYNKHMPKTFVLYSLLHELGHRSLIMRGYDHTSNKVFNKTFHDLQEEMLAWNEGLRWAKKLRITVNKTGYRMYACRALRTYVYGFFSVKVEAQKMQRALESIT